MREVFYKKVEEAGGIISGIGKDAWVRAIREGREER
jgi:hypothetical protein